jgi:hypothetical protein
MSVKLQEKAMLINLSISQWTGKKHDPKATREVIENYHAAPDSGRFMKQLVDHEAVQKYQKAANEARLWHYRNSLPWGDDGSRILPAKNYLHYMEKMRLFKTTFDASARDFIAIFPALVNRAVNELNGLFNPADYPTQAQLERKFGFSTAVNPLPEKDDFRVNLNQDEVEAIRQNIEDRLKFNIQDAMKDAWTRLFDSVKHLADKLKDKDAIFRDSIITNIKDLCELLPRLNVTEDPDLDRMISEVMAAFGDTDPDDLRKLEMARKATSIEADALLEKMKGYIE